MIRNAAALSLVLLLAGVHWASAACSDAPASAADTAVRAVFDAASDLQVNEEYQALHATLVEQLTHSANPRDWALAPDFDSAERRERLVRAADAAPDDALVVWLAAQVSSYTTDAAQSVDPAAERIGDRLLIVQPDNAAHLMPALARAVREHDGVATDRLLAAMAERSRFDTHFVDSLHAWLALAERSDTATTLSAMGQRAAEARPDETLDAEQLAVSASMTLSTAMAFSSATTLSDYPSLFHACRPDDDPAALTRRVDTCEKIGRLMAGQGDTMIERLVGDGLLRKIERRSDADRALRRRWEWLIAAYIELTNDDASFPVALIQRWRTSNDELAVMTETVQAVGVSLDPPADWVSPSEAREQENTKQA